MERVDELLVHRGLRKAGGANVVEPKWTYRTMDGSELVEEAYKRPHHITHKEKDPIQADS